MIGKLESFLKIVAAAYAPDLRVLAVLRIALGLWILWQPPDISWIADVPADFFNARPGLFQHLTGPPSQTVLTGLAVLTAILSVLVAVGAATVPASIALSAALITQAGISYSFSKVDHFILFELAPLFFAFAGWGRVLSVDALVLRRRSDVPRTASGFPILLYAITIAWGMLTAAVPKMLNGWWDPSRHASRGYLARDLVYDEKLGPLGPSLIRIDNSAFWKLLDYGTLVAEAGLIAVVFFPLAFRIWLALLACFHVGVYLTLGISFADYIFVYAAFFSPAWIWLARRLPGAVPLDRDGKTPTEEDRQLPSHPPSTTRLT